MAPDHRKTRLDLLAMAALVVLCASWGVQQVSVKIATEGIPPVLQVGLRSLFAGALVWIWAALRGVRLFERDGTLWLGLLIAFLFGFEFVVMYWGLEYTTASRGVIFIYTSPFFVAVGAHFFIPGERLSPLKIVGLVAAFVGVAIAFRDGLTMPGSRELLGDGMMLLGGAIWGATTVVIKATRLVAASPLKVLFYQLAGSAVMILPLAPLVGEPGIGKLTPAVAIAFAYQTVWVATITYIAWFWLMSRYPASALAAFTFLTPLFGIVAGGLMLGEPITLTLVMAMALVGGGIYLVNRAPKAS